MKRFLLSVGMLLLMSYTSTSHAWTVSVKNNCTRDVKIFVQGDHLFQFTTDCSVFIKSGATESCKMPGGICPTRIYVRYWVDSLPVDMPPVWCADMITTTCCWNVSYELVNDNGKCRAERR